MNIINPSVKLITQTEAFDGMFRHIEECGRTCYKSEDKITEDSARGFVQRMIESNHTAMLEHGTVYLALPMTREIGSDIVKRSWYHNNEVVKYRELFGYIQAIFMQNPYSIVNLHTDHDSNETIMCITTNYRVIIENGWEDIMTEFWSEPTQWHTPRFTLKFTTNIGVTREGNRMRANSIAEESTRYCNYSKDKFGNQLNIGKPTWIDFESVKGIKLQERTIDEHLEILREALNQTDLDYLTAEEWYGCAIAVCETAYKHLIRLGWKPQQAREVLPLATKSDVVYTAFPHQWRHFFDLRLFGKTGTPHPNMQNVAELAQQVLLVHNLWDKIYPETPTC